MIDANSVFAAMLRDYMWKQRTPPITTNRLASELGVSRNTVSRWLDGYKPSPEMAKMVARKLGLSLNDVMTALGYAVEGDTGFNEVFEDLIKWANENKSFDAEQRSGLLRQLAELRRRYETGELPIRPQEDDGDNHPKAKIAVAR